MRLPTLAAACMVLAACGGNKGDVTPTGDTGTDTTTDTDTDTTDTDTDTPTGNCANAVLDRYPTNGETDVFTWSGIDVTLSQPDASATIVVTDDAGGEVPGTVWLDGENKRLEFLPSQGFAAGGSYTATLEWACADSAVDFTVGSVGADPVADPSTLVDRGYSLDLKNGRFVAPDGIGDALNSLLEVKLLLGVTAADASSVSLRAGAEAAGGGQDTTATTTDFEDPATFVNPYFEVTQDVLPLVIEGDPIDVTDLAISGAFAADGSSIEGFRMSGIVDTRDLKDAVGVADDEGVCNLFAATFNVQCEECPGGGTYCINLVVADLPLPETGYPVDEVN